jgi:hypothetical protein
LPYRKLWIKAAYLTVTPKEGELVSCDEFKSMLYDVRSGISRDCNSSTIFRSIMRSAEAHDSFYSALAEGRVGSAVESNLWDKLFNEFGWLSDARLDCEISKSSKTLRSACPKEHSHAAISHLRSFALGMQLRRDAHAALPQELEDELLPALKGALSQAFADPGSIESLSAKISYEFALKNLSELDLPSSTPQQLHRIGTLKYCLEALNISLHLFGGSGGFSLQTKPPIAHGIDALYEASQFIESADSSPLPEGDIVHNISEIIKGLELTSKDLEAHLDLHFRSLDTLAKSAFCWLCGFNKNVRHKHTESVVLHMLE